MLTPNFREVGRFEEHTLVDGSVLYYEADKHAYYGEIKPSKSATGGYSYVRDSRLTGVSTIAKHINDQGDGLLWWAAEKDQEGIAQLVTRDMEMGADLSWLTDAKEIGRRLREAELTWKNVREQMADWGTNVHELTFLALAVEGKQPSLADLAPEERGFGQAVFAWWLKRTPEPVAAEQITVSHSNKFAGRFDLLADCDVDGETVRVLVDAKTRTSGKPRRSDHAQLAGYEVANRECGIGESERRLALLLMPDGTYHEEWGKAADTDFFAALNACKAGKHLDKRMRDAAKAEKEPVVA